MKDFTSEEWIVAFYSKGEGFFDKFLWKKSQYRHVSLFCRRKLGWYMFSPHPKYWLFKELELAATTEMEDKLFKMKSCFAWIKLKVEKPSCQIAPLLIPTCVQVIKRLMGIKTGYCASGHGLWKQLLRYDTKTNYKIIDLRSR